MTDHKGATKGIFFYLLLGWFASVFFVFVLSLLEPKISRLYETRSYLVKSTLVAAIIFYGLICGMREIIRRDIEAEMKEERLNTVGGILQSIKELDVLILVTVDEKSKKIYTETRNMLQKIVDDHLVVYMAEQIVKTD